MALIPRVARLVARLVLQPPVGEVVVVVLPAVGAVVVVVAPAVGVVVVVVVGVPKGALALGGVRLG
jgi:hypothetical protein